MLSVPLDQSKGPNSQFQDKSHSKPYPGSDWEKRQRSVPKKRRLGMPPMTKGGMRLQGWYDQRVHPLQVVGPSVSVVNEVQKKGGVFPKHPRVLYACPPSPEGSFVTLT